MAGRWIKAKRREDEQPLPLGTGESILFAITEGEYNAEYLWTPKSGAYVSIGKSHTAQHLGGYETGIITDLLIHRTSSLS